MKIILTTLNSKYIHSNLAIRYLSKYVEEVTATEIVEFTINQSLDFILSELHKMKGDIVAFSTYIWNIEETLKISRSLKAVNPNMKIILGGPEVSYDGREVMENHPYIDYIVYGEGEATFKELIDMEINENKNPEDIHGLIHRKNDLIIENRPRDLIMDLNTIESPYINGVNEFKNKIIYYESSRGCPFNCQFCLSSTIRGVRYFDIERVKKDIGQLIDWEVQQVKFVDRTFNANKKYAMEIMSFIMEKNPKDINFHFEVTAHLIDDEMLDFLSKAKEGIFQFEAGVQSTNPETIDAIGRTTDFPKLKEVVKKISSFKNIHQHLDLIAGLPYENIESFEKSFNDVYELHPEKLQLGFLKLLKGSGLRFDAEKYGYKYRVEAPYEVLENDFMDYNDIIKLKSIEDLVEKYYNEDYFKNTLAFIVKNYYQGAYSLYEEFANYWEEKNYHHISHGRNRLYIILKEFIEYKSYPHQEILKNLLQFDYLKNHKSRLPNGLYNKDTNLLQKDIHRILKDEELLDSYLEDQKEKTTKKIIKNVSIERFTFNLLDLIKRDYNPLNLMGEERYILFDYKEGQIIRSHYYDITEKVKELV